MANPEVMKRLEEIEKRAKQEQTYFSDSHHFSEKGPEPSEDVAYLLKLTRALLESQMEIIETGRKATNCGHERPVLGCLDRLCWMLARAEKVRKGEV